MKRTLPWRDHADSGPAKPNCMPYSAHCHISVRLLLPPTSTLLAGTCSTGANSRFASGSPSRPP